MLVIMEHGDVHEFAQALFDDETIRCLDVFKVYAAECRAKIAYSPNELFNVFRINFKVNRINIGKTLEQNRFSFHHGLGRQGPKITQTQNGRAIGNHRHQIALGRVVISRIGVFSDAAHGCRHTGAIGQRQVTLGGHGFGRVDFELSWLSALVELQRLLIRHRRAAGGFARRNGHDGEVFQGLLSESETRGLNCRPQPAKR